MTTLTNIAEQLLFRNTASVDLEKHGYTFRKGKGYFDMVEATKKSLRTPPFKTEYHIQTLEGLLGGILKKVRRA